MNLVELVYDFTKSFPENEKYGLTSQMRRAVISIPSNIAEGAARKGDKELIHFLMISLGSLSELETQYLISLRLKLSCKNEKIEKTIEETKKLLLGFRNYLKKKIVKSEK